jgi:hypothetical protein
MSKFSDTAEHNAHMNKMAIRLGKVLDGEEGFDAACACALCAVFGLHSGFGEDHDGKRNALEIVIEFMRKQLEEMIADEN